MKMMFIVMLLIISSPAGAEIYRWRDDNGVSHYSNSMDDVPLRFRSAVKSLNYDQADKAASGSQNESSAVSKSSASRVQSPSAGVPSTRGLKFRHRSIRSTQRHDDDE